MRSIIVTAGTALFVALVGCAAHTTDDATNDPATESSDQDLKQCKGMLPHNCMV